MDLARFNGMAFAKGVPQVNDVGDDGAFTLLRFYFLRQQCFAKASLNAKDLCLH